MVCHSFSSPRMRRCRQQLLSGLSDEFECSNSIMLLVSKPSLS